MLDTTANHVFDAHNRPDHLRCYCNSTRAGWIVATTHVQAELWADANLRRRGYRTYLPQHAVRRRDRTIPTLIRIAIAPLWPGYIFVHHDTADSWRPIYETPGVRAVIRTRDQIQFAPDSAVSALQASEDARQALPAPEHQWAPGTPCTPLLGPMRGLPAVILSLSCRDLANIGLMFLGELRQISMNVDCLTVREDA